MNNIFLKDDYPSYVRRKFLFVFFLFVVLFGLVILSLGVGSSGLNFTDIVRVLMGKGSLQHRIIILNVRLPRLFTAVGVGASLAVAGCMMQNVLRNQLASASTLGVAQGASFGAAVGIIVLGGGSQITAVTNSAINITNPYLVSTMAFVGGITTTFLILILAKFVRLSSSSMVLCGVALSSLFVGATALIQYFADDVMVAGVVYWTFGNLGRAGWQEILLIYLVLLPTLAFFSYHRWNFNAVEGGMAIAKSLGVPVDFLLIATMVLSTLISATSVAFVGSINFVGLLSSHMIRPVVGTDYRFLLPGSAMMGAILLLLADFFARTVVSPVVLPIGAVTSFVGAPLFLYLIIKRGNFK